MSYCRWSSMNWMCDVYVYESVDGGWVTHVAARRRIIPPIPDLWRWSPRHSWGLAIDVNADNKQQRWRGIVYRCYIRLCAFWHKHVHMRSLELIPLRRIGLPYAGESFLDPTPGDCADRLKHLQALGYNVPQYAIDELIVEDLSK